VTKEFLPVGEFCAAGCGNLRKPQSGVRPVHTCGAKVCLDAARKHGVRKLLELRFGEGLISPEDVAPIPWIRENLDRVERHLRKEIREAERHLLNFEGASERARRLSVPQEGPFRVREASNG